MALLFDTNILLYLARNSNAKKIVNPSNEVEYISVVTVGEARSIAFQNGWGNAKTEKLESALSKAIILDINNEIIIDRYVQIDAYSQKKHPAIPYSFETPRNMGKNDLWSSYSFFPGSTPSYY
jgi:tRNA(fMet)-specific endonuclease VapC